MEEIAIARTDQGIDAAVERVFELTDFQIDSDLPVFIKANLNCIKTCETGATTDPCVVESILRLMRTTYRQGCECN